MKTMVLSKFPSVPFLITLAILNTLVPVARSQVTFSTPPTWPTGTGSIFVADFNDDGKPDILSASGNLSLGNGNGTFKTGTTVPGTTVAVADFNGDGKPDVLELGTGSLQVLLGNGDGTFQAPIVTNIAADLTVVATTDLNGDGKADVVGIFNNTLMVYLANGDGTFAAGVPYSLGTITIPSSALILFGDSNVDHKTDVALIVPGTPGQEIVLLGNGDGTLQPTLHTSTGIAATESAIPTVLGDFNGDGKLDIATLEIGPAQGTVFLLLGNGDGTFQAPAAAFNFQYSGLGAELSEAADLATADVNKDGKLDLVVTADVIGIYLGNGDGTFSSSPNYYEPSAPGGLQLAIADFNLDGNPDIAFDGEILLGNGNGTFRGISAVLLGAGQGPEVVGTFVKNGAPAVAVIPSVPGSVNPGTSLKIFTNDGSGNLTLAHTYTLPQAGYVIAAADLNGDSNLDLVVEGKDPSSQNWSYTVLLGNGDGSFRTPLLYQQSAQATELVYPIVIADFNNDHKPDLAFAQGNQTFAVLLGNGDGTFGAPSYVFDGDGGPIVSADFNGDKNQDVAEFGPSGLAIVLGKGDGTFQNATFTVTTSLYSDAVLAGDVNGDGKVDLIAGNIVLLGNGDGTFNALPPFGAPEATSSPIALADFNGDGKLDVLMAVAPESAAVTSDNRYLGNGDGTFGTAINVPSTPNPPHTLPQILQVADMNGDSKPDLVIENYSGTLFVLLNSTATITPDFTIGMPTGGSSSTISAGGTATFNLSLTAAGSFNGIVNLACSITPAVTPAPVCSVPASVNVRGSSATPVTVTVATTAAGTSSSGPSTFLRPPTWLIEWTLFLGALGLLFVGKRRRLRTLYSPVIVLAFLVMSGCGGGNSSSTTPPSTASKGTPTGTYTASITATSGSLSHQVMLTVNVQ